MNSVQETAYVFVLLDKIKNEPSLHLLFSVGRGIGVGVTLSFLKFS